MHLGGGGEHFLWKVTYLAGRKDYFPHNSLIDLNLFQVPYSFVSQYPVLTIISTEVWETGHCH